MGYYSENQDIQILAGQEILPGFWENTAERSMPSGFYTQEEEKYLADLSSIRQGMISDIEKNNTRLEQARKTGDDDLIEQLERIIEDAWSEYDKLSDKRQEILDEAKARYANTLQGDPEPLLRDIRRIMKSATKDQYKAWQEKRTSALDHDIQLLLDEKDPLSRSRILLTQLQNATTPGVDNAKKFLIKLCRTHLEVLLLMDSRAYDDALIIINDRAAAFYPDRGRRSFLEESKENYGTVGPLLASLSDSGYINQFNIPSIRRLPTTSTSSLLSSGELSPAFDQNSLVKLSQVDQAMLLLIFTAMWNRLPYMITPGSCEVAVYLPQFCEEIGLEVRDNAKKRDNDIYVSMREQRLDAVLRRVNQFRNLVGRTRNGSFYSILIALDYDAETDTMKLVSPYLGKILEEVGAHPKLCRLIHSNKAMHYSSYSFEIANYILNALLRKGNTGKPYSASWAFIIDKCPQLKARLAEILSGHRMDPETGQPYKSHPTIAYNKCLRDSIRGAIDLIEKDSDAPRYFKDFKISSPNSSAIIYPTKTTLKKTVIQIHHAGKNENYHSAGG